MSRRAFLRASLLLLPLPSAVLAACAPSATYEPPVRPVGFGIDQPGRPPAEVGMDALGRLSEMSRQILALAKREAAFFQHDQVRPEHLLLALAAVPEAVASRLLRRQGVDPQAVVREVVAHLHIGRAVDSRSITLSLGARRAIEIAGLEAQRLGSEYIGTEHLLLGIMAERDSLAGRALAKLGVDPDVVR